MLYESVSAAPCRGNSVLRSLLHIDGLLDRIADLTKNAGLLHQRFQSTTLQSDRETMVARLREEVTILDRHVEEHKKAVRSINFQDIVALYGVAGRTSEEALAEVQGDFEGVGSMVEEMRRCAREALADAVHEGTETPSTGSEIDLSEEE
ncbi:hypothetical protein DM02DRAFT_204717 [Periconia macrospinosa]|uniref:Uncharacterized protein n=1 Tax=Periconia macrospinosa TaxID=97972 RepID=A0A2V1D7S2_9PLEO|nr:hypothetical protein DM02DRAFT_204717 [Periconia macrospinosa]